MLTRSSRFLAVIPLCLLLFGCSPKIGNKCSLSTDCSQLGDRLCDTTQPDGYCTIFNCEPDTCPDAVCVGFSSQLDPACGAADDGRSPRFERTFCMKPCGDDGDCREQYACVSPLERAAEIVDSLASWPADQKVCMVATTNPAVVSTSPPAVCGPGDAGAPIGDSGVPWVPYKPDGGAGGAGGASGVGGNGGAGGNGGKGGS